MCSQVLHCKEAGRVAMLLSAIGFMDRWLQVLGTDPDLRHCIMLYAHARGGEMMVDICSPFPRFWDLTKAQDAIRWSKFLKGMITTKMVDAQVRFQQCTGGEITIDKWVLGLVIKLLECTHGQWLYRNVVVHGVDVERLSMQCSQWL